MAEYIDREAAVASLCCDCSATGDCRPGERCVDYERLKSIPAADVKPVVHARWIGVALGDMRCSDCGEVYGVCGGLMGDYNFCPNCGADMREEEVKQDPTPDPKPTFYDLLYEEGGANTT